MVQLYAKVSEDGYLFGATDNDNGDSDHFWPEDIRDEGTVLITVPEDMAQDLIDHGTSAQTYSDGYEAWQDVLKRGSFVEL